MSEISRRRAARAAADSPGYTERVLAIREAAVRVFRARGFQAATLNDVAEEAGMSRAALYYYVGSKEQLFRDVVSEAVTVNIADAEEVAARDLPADRKLALLIELLMESFERHYPYLYVFVQEDFSKLGGESARAHGSWEATIQDWNKRYLDLVKQVVADGIASGELRTTLPPGVVANCLIGMTNSSHAWFRPHGLMDATEIGAGMARMILDGIRPARQPHHL
jgi:TetR/AcrR family transcriptional regulator, cholesterol catabolism regulator